MPDRRRARGLIDTSVVIALGELVAEDLPTEGAIAALTLAELSAGPHAAAEPATRAIRRERLEWAERTFEVLAFTSAAARAYGSVYAATLEAGRKPRGRRAMDLLIAATALASDLPLYTRNPGDLAGLEELLDVVAVPAA